MIEEASVNCGDGLNCAYRDTISWQGPNSPLPMENNPQVIFERLFGDGNTAAEREARRAQSISLLDSVLGEASALQRTLPTSDRSRLDQYLTDVREIERRIQKAGRALSADLPVPAAPTGIPSDIEEHIKLMLDLQVLAWQADITRVSTLLLAKELSGAVYPKSTIRDAFHTLSHHSNIQQNKDRFAVLNTYHVALFQYFLDKLQSTPDGDGTLLDHSMVLYGSGMSDGNQHNHTDLPIIVAGGASGRLKGGRHIRNPKKTPMANLLLAMLDKMQVPVGEVRGFHRTGGHLDRRVRLAGLRARRNPPSRQLADTAGGSTPRRRSTALTQSTPAIRLETGPGSRWGFQALLPAQAAWDLRRVVDCVIGEPANVTQVFSY